MRRNPSGVKIVGAVAGALFLVFVAFGPTPEVFQGAAAQEDVQIETIALAGGVYMLVGRGGNLGLSVGEDGPLLIDDQFADLSKKIQAAVKKLHPDPVRFLINTHLHGDHTGGNENFSKAGAIIVAHDNVRRRMSAKQPRESSQRSTPKAALPVVTFREQVTFHWNGDDVDVIHVAPAHTDGDSIIYFKNANVLHMGDNFLGE